MPEYNYTLLCLANSRKTSGRCIAGKIIQDGQVGAWVRPISNRATSELSEEERRFENGRDPSVLDIVQVEMLGASAHAYQTENHIINDAYYWSFIRRATNQEILAAIDVSAGTLWGTSSSSYSGVNDRIEVFAAPQFASTLCFISVPSLQIRVSAEGARFGNMKRNVRGRFTYNGQQYFLMITDPVIERHYLDGQDGLFEVGRRLLCISLGDAYEGYAYKLIAGIVSV
jgi:hypothetical protein